MSISSLFSDIKFKVFGFNKPTPMAKITPIMDTEYTPDLEAGEGGFYKRIKERQSALEFSSKPLNHDVEKGDTSIICGEVAVDINGYEKCKIIENYVSFMDVVSYFATPIAERGILSLPCTMDDLVKTVSESNQHSHIAIDIISENDFIEVPLHLCSSNIL